MSKQDLDVLIAFIKVVKKLLEQNKSDQALDLITSYLDSLTAE